MSNERIAEVLEKAADLLESEELIWGKGDYDDGMKTVCSMGALCRASGEKWTDLHPLATAAAEPMKVYLVDKVVDVVRKESTPGAVVDPNKWCAVSIVITYNDRIAQDKAEMIEAMKLAAKDVRNQA